MKKACFLVLLILALLAVAQADMVLPAGLTEIGEEAFINTELSGTLTIPEGVTTIGARAFYGCDEITELVLPSTVTSIESQAFAGCYELAGNVILMQDCEVAADAFDGCPDFTLQVLMCTPVEYFEYKIVNGKVEITKFNNPGNITALVFPSEIEGYPVTVISQTVAHSDRVLQSVFFPDSITDIREAAFRDCTNLRSIKLPASLTSIKTGAFSHCESLQNVVLPEQLTSIGESVFEDCINLQSIGLPSSLTSIGASAFDNCASLQSIKLPENLTCIEAATFLDCDSLQSLELSPRLISIDDHAFARCTSLQSIELPESLISVAKNAFYCCTSLQSIELPESLTSIGSYAFWNCTSLQSIELPESLTSIGKFTFEQCTSLQSIELPESLTTIAEGAFRDCTSLQNIELPVNLTTIAGRAFWGCTSLQNIELPVNLTTIARGAFYNCTSLQGIKLPANLTSIGDQALYGCTSLQSIEFPPSLTSIGVQALYGCTSLQSIEFPPSLTNIGVQALCRCTSLLSIRLPANLVNIEANAFNGCTGLMYVYIPPSVKRIPGNIFEECSSSLVIYGVAASYAETYANKYSIDFCPIFVEDFPPADYYWVVAAYAYNGKTYGEAVLTKPYKGVPTNDFFFIDKSGKSVTDPETICALWSMRMYREMESSVLQNVSDLNSIAKIWSSTAIGFMKKEIAWQSGGEAVGTLLKGFVNQKWITVFKELVVDNLLDGNEASAWMQMATVSDLLSYMDDLVVYINQLPATDASGIYQYENVDKLIYTYFSYLYAYEVANNLCKPIIDEIINEYKDDADVAWHFLWEALSSTATSYSDTVKTFFNFAGLCIEQNDAAAWSTITSFLDGIKEMDETGIGQLVNVTKTMELINQSLDTITKIKDGFIVTENDWMEIYFKTPGEVVDTELYRIQLLMAQ